MKNLDSIAKDLFNKIRGRFPNIILGDDEGNVTNIPSNARYFDFAFLNEKEKKVSVSLDQDNGIVVIVGKNIVGDQPEHIQDKWYNFLKELRVFSKKRLLNFDVRDINKSILNKRDYKFLAATRPGDETMAESKMYGTNKTSYQRIGNARLAIKHTHPINLESTGSRSQKIKAIYVESPEGERFKYPYNHVAGARAMARHVSEGGNAYDDFGKYISGLSNEASKLQKFKKYMNRSSVMAETLSGYMDTVNTRIQEVKKEIIHLQKEGFYKQAIENFTVPVVEDVPEGVSENWIDQLTIKQFNEELKDVFPYIYKLIGEATKVKDLGPEDLDEAELDTDETNEAGGIGGGMSGTKFSKAADYAPAVGAGVRGAVDNFTMGGGKYARAAADYGIKNLGALAGKNDPTTWDKEIGQEREKDIAAQTNYPLAWDIGDKAATVAQMASGVGAGKVLATKAARAAAASAASSVAAKAAAKKAAADSKYKAMGMSDAELANAMKISKSPELARELQRRIALQKLPNLPVPKPLNLTPQMRVPPTSTLKLTPGMRTTPTSEDLEIEAAFESMIGQFADHVYKATTDTIDESGLQYYTGVKKHGKEYMKKAAQAGREGASQEELGRLKDKYSKAEKNTKEDIDIDDDLDEAEKKGLYYYVNKRKKAGTSRPKNHPKAPSTQDWKNAAKTAKEDLEIEAAFESMMGQFSDHVCEDCGNPSWRTLSEEKQKGVDGKVCWKGYKRMGTKMKGGKRVDNCVKVSEATPNSGSYSGMNDNELVAAYAMHKNQARVSKLSNKKGLEYTHQLAMSEIEAEQKRRGMKSESIVDEGIKGKLAMLALLGLTGMGTMKAIDPSNSPLGQALQSAAEQGDEDAAMHLKNLGAYIDGNDSQTLRMLNFQYVDEPASMKDDATVPNDSTSSPLSKTRKTPIGEFILSYFDRETGRFPKGETAVLTAVQKDYGDQYVKPAVEFIKKVEAMTAKKQVEKIQNSPHPETEMIKHLAGV
jgi:hypothetical protein